MKIISIETGNFKLDGGAMFGVVPKSLWERTNPADDRNLCSWAMGSMLVFSTVLFLPVVSDSRVNALADLLGLFYIAQAGVVGAYMGVSAYMSRK